METHENSEQGQPLAVPLERPVRPDLADALAAYWDAAYAEGRDGRTHDTEDGAAQRALNSVHDAVRDLLAAERERCAVICEGMGAMEALEGEEEGSAAMVRVADRMADLCAVAMRKA